MFNLMQIMAQADRDIEGDINALSIRTIAIAALVLVVLLALAAVVVKNDKHKALKKPLFIMIASTIILPSLLLVGSTVYINAISESKGPVHWHTDIEFWVCGQEIELRDPYAFLSNKIGTSTYHEHDDKRIHLEGVVIEKEYDASLEKFMAVTGGAISNSQLVIPTDPQLFENDTDGDSNANNEDIVRGFSAEDSDGRTILSLENGDSCSPPSSAVQTPAEVQAFLIRYEKSNDTYSQTKLQDPKRYVMRDESIVPPGDCIIVEFDTRKDRTEKLCEQYGVRDNERCTDFGVSEFNPDLCSLRQINSQGGDL